MTVWCSCVKKKKNPKEHSWCHFERPTKTRHGCARVCKHGVLHVPGYKKRSKPKVVIQTSKQTQPCSPVRIASVHVFAGMSLCVFNASFSSAPPPSPSPPPQEGCQREDTPFFSQVRKATWALKETEVCLCVFYVRLCVLAR